MKKNDWFALAAKPVRQTAQHLMLVGATAMVVAVFASPSSAVPIAPGEADYRWLFDDGSGTVVTESGAAGALKHGAFNGAPTWSMQTPFTYSGNFSLDTSGDSGHAVVNAFNVNMGTQSTMSMWVRRTGSGGTPRYVHDTAAGTGRTLWYYNSAGGPQGDAIYWNNVNQGGAGLSALPLDEWVHLALVRDGTTLRVYEDGDLVNTTNVAAGAVTFGNLFFGARQSNNERFAGQIDEYGYWLSALTDDNIEWLSQNSISPAPAAAVPEPATLGVWLLVAAVGLGWGLRRRSRKRPS